MIRQIAEITIQNSLIAIISKDVQRSTSQVFFHVWFQKIMKLNFDKNEKKY